MAPNTNTTVIFVPGAWHGPEFFSEVRQHLEAQGYATDAVSLKSVGPAEHLKDFGPDVKLIQEHIGRAADAGQEVVLVCHSYGAMPATECVQGYEVETRAKAGKKGGVRHVCYLAAFIIAEGNSLISAFGGDLPWFNISEDKQEVNPDGPGFVFYNDVSDEKAQAAIKELKPHSYQTLHSPLTYAAWKHVPASYIYTTNDNAIPLHIQKMMVEEVGKGYDIRTETLDASHSPFLSVPKETAAAIAKVSA
ncbi:Alpha/beta hydrolase fold-1 [Neohortaea acidophila]|uniref:Alpha/beta hydrolase fold-1 n=1 Tax=Neohortaea acidophila TaxID=245834 RepID=A0A6A6PW34_9PEZI|nr:Alpha/beta hydrolase fold-1 [Neohortaea acidophila]KAF2483976.1 Alpha/beta hydrolase fold-1 [Neohortaea acidophila]